MSPADIWLHGASIGDMRALAPLVAALQRTRPDWRLRITAMTREGRTMAAQLFPELPRGRPPLDVPPLPGRALDRVRPRLLVLEYLELWPAWIAACARRGIRTAVVDGRITHRSLRVRGLLRRAAARLDLFCARTDEDAENARALGVRPERIRICGNGKYDAVPVDPPRPSPALEAAIGAVDLVVGSLHPDEEADALAALAGVPQTVLIAPRYPSRVPAVLRRARRLGVTARRRSTPGPSARWIVLDTVGELAAAYALGRVAIVGGTFGRRDGQNLVEPAAHGRPVIHGPRVGNVAVEAACLAGAGGWPVADWTEAVAVACHRRVDPGPDPRPALRNLRGATQRNLDALMSIIDPG